MMGARSGTGTPIGRAVAAMPAWIDRVLSDGGRAAGALLAIAIAANQAHDRTQVFATVLAMLTAASFVPLPRAIAGVVVAAASGALFFAGAALWSQTAGIAITAAGAAAAAGVLSGAIRGGRSPGWPLAAFFGALGMVIAAVITIALAVEG